MPEVAIKSGADLLQELMAVSDGQHQHSEVFSGLIVYKFKSVPGFRAVMFDQNTGKYTYGDFHPEQAADFCKVDGETDAEILMNYPNTKGAGSNGERQWERDGLYPARMFSRSRLAETFAGEPRLQLRLDVEKPCRRTGKTGYAPIENNRQVPAPT